MFYKRRKRSILLFFPISYLHKVFWKESGLLVKVWENSKKLWKHSSAARVPTAFLVLPNVHSCLYNSIETRYMFSISKMEMLKPVINRLVKFWSCSGKNLIIISFDISEWSTVELFTQIMTIYSHSKISCQHASQQSQSGSLPSVPLVCIHLPWT